MTLPVFPTLPGLTFTQLKTPIFDTLVMGAPNGYEVRIAQTINPRWERTLLFDFLHDFFWGGFTIISELRTLLGFFCQMSGQAGAFLYTDVDDSNVGPALSTIGWAALTNYPLGYGILDSSNHWQMITTPGTSGATVPTFNHTGGTTSDGTATWTDQGAYSASGIPNVFLAGLPVVTDGLGHWFSPLQRTFDGVFFEDITDLNGAIAVYANATLATAGSGAGQYSLLGPGLATPTRSYMGLYLQWGTTVHNVWEHAAWSLGDTIIDPAGHVQTVTTAGTSGTTIPVFDDSGGTTTDGSVVWTDSGYNPAPVSNVSAQFNFYFRHRFASDQQDFEKFLGNVIAGLAGQGGAYWTIGGSEAQQGSGTLKLTTARPVPL